MIRLARHIKAIEPEVTVLQIQKVMYFTLGSYMNVHGVDSITRNIYTSNFEAWDLGPVNREVYKEYKQGSLTAEYQKDLELFNPFIKEYLERNIYDLVDDSHKEGTHWWRNRVAIQDRARLIYYELEDILNDYQEISR